MATEIQGRLAVSKNWIDLAWQHFKRDRFGKQKTFSASFLPPFFLKSSASLIISESETPSDTVLNAMINTASKPPVQAATTVDQSSYVYPYVYVNPWPWFWWGYEPYYYGSGYHGGGYHNWH